MTATSGLEPVAALRGRQPSAEVTRAVQLASAETGVDFSYLLAKAAVESNFDANAKARTSSASGLFQFIESTWMAMIRDHGAEHGYGRYAEAIRKGNLSPELRQEILDLRFDPKASALMAAEYTSDNRAYLERKVGGEITEADLYLAHFLGAGGAGKFLNAMRENPDRIAADLFPKAARANKPVFYKDGRPCTLAEVHARFAEKFNVCIEKQAGPVTGYTLPTSAMSGPTALFEGMHFPEFVSGGGPVGPAGPAQPGAVGLSMIAATAADGRSAALFDSLYFAELPARGGPVAQTESDEQRKRDSTPAEASAADWAFLRPVGARPPLPEPASTLPANLSFAVQLALAALDAPGRAGTESANGPVWTV